MEKAVCADTGLSTLDRTLGDAYAKAMREWPETTRVKQRAAQRAWVAQRNGCAKASDVKACLDGVYRRRTIEVQITSGQLTAPTPVGFVCKGYESQPFTITFYNQTDPKSAVMTMGNRQAVLMSAPSGSGARYTGTDAEFWEHQGEATVTWAKDQFTCKQSHPGSDLDFLKNYAEKTSPLENRGLTPPSPLFLLVSDLVGV